MSNVELIGSEFNEDIVRGFEQRIAEVKFPLHSATYAIKAMEQEDIISFNEVFFKPSTVVFTTNREELTDFEKQNPSLEPLLKGLLRSYEGIFDFPATVYESKLAKFIQVDMESLKKDLRRLNDYGIISYSAQKDKPGGKGDAGSPNGKPDSYGNNPGGKTGGGA